MYSKHYAKDRKIREAVIREIGEGDIYQKFTVYNQKRQEPEIHILTTNGIIEIRNYFNRKIVTKLIARPGQIKRYYPDGNAPQNIINVAFQHQKLGLNHI